MQNYFILTFKAKSLIFFNIGNLEWLLDIVDNILPSIFQIF